MSVTQINADNIQDATLAMFSPPKCTNVQITNSSYVVLDDTAVSLAGGYIKITGTGFTSGCQVIIGTTNATSVSFINSTTVNAQVGPQVAGTYIVYVVNPNGSTAIRVNGLTFSDAPTWVTTSPLPDNNAGTAISIQLSATLATVYQVQAGSTLPSGLSLSSSGLLSGTVTGITSQTVYNFIIEAIDPELQDSPKSFSITITVGDSNYNYVTTLLSANIPVLPFNADASANNFAVSVIGDTKPNNFNPYTPGYYSGYFDGVGDNLSITSGPFVFGANNFTVEAWVYTTAYNTSGNGGEIVIDNWAGSPSGSYITNQWQLWITSAGILQFLYATGASTIIYTGTGTVPLNTWNHVAAVRNGSTLTVYLNGVASGTSAISQSIGVAAVSSIGQQTAGTSRYYFTGYISNARTVNGTAVYTTAFTPPTAPLTAIANTSLLTCQSNRFIDNSTNNFTITVVGDTKILSAMPFIANSSYATYGSTYFDGTGDNLSLTGSDLGSGNFTIEMWVYFTSYPNAQNAIYSNGTADNVNSSTTVVYINSSGTLAMYNYPNSITTTGTVSLSQWNHVAVVRNSGTISLYINGVSSGSGANSNNISNTTVQVMKGYGGIANSPIGYVSNLRVVKGTAVYTTTFTPPTTPLTAITNTSLLTCQSDQSVNNSVFLDDSNFSQLITRAGNTTNGTLSPYNGVYSNYFNGTTDYLTVPANTAFAFGTGDFTVECWVYTSAPIGGGVTNDRFIFGGFTTAPSCVFALSNDTNVPLIWNGTTGYYSSIAVTANSWTHVAWVRNSSTLNIYVNGVLGKTQASYTTNFTATRTSYIGRSDADATRYFPGYISNLRVIKGTAVYTNTFTPPISPLTPITNTSLLTCSTTRFSDSSMNNFTITRAGSTTVNRFTPLSVQTPTIPISYSGYFDGTGDYLRVPTTTALSFGTGDFTVECWVYKTSAQTSSIIDGRVDPGGAAPWAFFIDASNFPYFYQGTSYTSTVAVTLNSWTHIAVARSSGTLKIFVNGVQGFTGSITTNLDRTAGAFIGVSANTTTPAGYYIGYMSNLRVVKGTALYTTAFTPPTAPLTAISGTSLLTCQSATFIDNSTNNFTITAVGDSKPLQQNPFGYTAGTVQGYTAALYGGSMYLDGTGDYLVVPTNSSLSVGATNDFTVECWVFPTVISSVQGIFGKHGGSGANAGYGMYMNAGVLTGQIWNNGTANSVTATGATLIVGQWQHVAMVRSSGTLRMYVNGIGGTGVSTLSYNPNNTQNLNIGVYEALLYPYTGYISNFRLVNSTALYKANFVPTQTPLTAIASTSLLVNGTSAAIYDSSMLNDFETGGDAKISASVKKYGNSSIYFDGTGDYLTAPYSPNMLLGTGNFTIEFWAYFNSVASGQTLAKQDNNSTTFTWVFNVPSTGTLSYYLSSTGSTWNISSAVSIGSIVINSWYHVALVRNGSTFTPYLNGVAGTPTTNSAALFASTSPLLVGAGATGGNVPFNGYIDDFRITRGVARYTTAFTPPTTPFSTK